MQMYTSTNIYNNNNSKNKQINTFKSSNFMPPLFLRRPPHSEQLIDAREASEAHVVILDPGRTKERITTSAAAAAAAQPGFEWQVKLELNPESLGKSHAETAPFHKAKALHGCHRKSG